MWIQIILIAAILALGFAFFRRPGSDSHLAIQRLLLLGFVLIAILSVLFPTWLSWLANLLGVGRGTDLLLYGLLVVFLVFVYTQYRRNVDLNRRITQLSRRIALDEALAREKTTADDPGDR